ncbi:uncharacterized protein LOC142775015 [Rhipicephalus microplus]|uniref:uncharacterized protein LOC142775015 n=1 Tax=Rhipicephalus microplus TaxID=6941 RepID=UPI003F6A5441
MRDRVRALCTEDFTLGELHLASVSRRRCSSPGADGVTYQMLGHLDQSKPPVLLAAYNDVWHTKIVPQQWRDVILVPVIEKGKPASEPASYSSSVRLSRATANALADVIETLEEAPHNGEAGYLILIGIRVEFYSLPHGSVLSPFLFNLALADINDHLPRALPCDVQAVVNADDIALFATAHVPNGLRARTSAQTVLNSMDKFITGKAMIIHTSYATERYTSMFTLLSPFLEKGEWPTWECSWTNASNGHQQSATSF